MAATDDDPGTYPYLSSLNEAQLRAVIAPPTVPLQILAGPGSGKTRVLTSRVAHLVKRHEYSPRSIIAVTFTNKAAAEMRKRLNVLLGEPVANQLVLGTFHATCAKYLRRNGPRIGLNSNFGIADADDCKKIITRLLKDRKAELTKLHLSIKPGGVLSEISKAKAKGETPGAMAVRAAKPPAASVLGDSPPVPLKVIAELYEEYEAALREADALDFDDLLLYGLKLFTTYPETVAHCRHVLVDEFQDTNTTQYELMKCFAKTHGGVSIVGDPDQSIYGWRSAEVENLHYMTKDFRNVDVICLEENYRSTGAILAASHAIVSQDSNRIPKSLFTSHPNSTPVPLKLFTTPVIEASFIATEIKRIATCTGNMLNYDDFAILLRYNALSRVLESALQKEGIPSRIIGGHKFFERMEVKDLLAYLQLADNPNFNPAFMRVINVPKRRLGDTSVAKIVGAAREMRVPPMEMCEGIIDGAPLPAGITPAIKRDLASFVKVVRDLRRAALKGLPVRDLIELIVKKTKYEEHLRNMDDFDQRWENVKELISFSVVVEQDQIREEQGDEPADFTSVSELLRRQNADNIVQDASGTFNSTHEERKLHPIFHKNSSDGFSRSHSMSSDMGKKKKPLYTEEDNVIEILSSDDEIEAFDAKSPSPQDPYVAEDGLNPLRVFLQSSMLSTDTGDGDDGKQVPKVTISTVHAAKGLEWPVVFVPAVEQGTFPASRCVEDKEIAEERRLLYVAMTRAQTFLCLSYTMERMVGGDTKDRNLSEFVDLAMRRDVNTFTSTLPDIDEAVRKQVSAMLGRPLPDEVATKEKITKFLRIAPPASTWDAPERNQNRFGRRDGPGLMSRAFEYWASDADEYAPAIASGSRPGFVAFSSAKSFIPPHTAPPISKPPIQKIQSSNRNLPPPMPFTFESEVRRPAANLSSFTSGSTSSLAAMKTLGLPEPTRPTSAPATRRSDPATHGSMSPAMSPWAPPNRSGTGLGTVDCPTVEACQGDEQTGTSAIPLARGTKRLGMRRSLAPWDSKRPKI